MQSEKIACVTRELEDLLMIEEKRGTLQEKKGSVADSLHTCFLVSFLMAAVVVDIVSTFFSVFDATDTATDRGFTFIVLT